MHHLELSDVFLSDCVLSHNHILHLISCALKHMSTLRPLHANSSLMSVSWEQWVSVYTVCTHEGDKPGHEAEAAHRGRGWTGVWATPSDISMRSTKYSAFIEAHWWVATITNMFLHCVSLTVTMFFSHVRPHVVNILYSAACSLLGSSARGAFAPQAGARGPSLSPAWRWGLPFIYRLRANCYSAALATQRCILCPLGGGRILLDTGNKLPTCSLLEGFKRSVAHRKYKRW